MNAQTLFSLHTNQRLLLQELMARGVKINLLVHELELVEAIYGNHRELLLDRDSAACPYPASVLSADKYVTKKLLARAGLSVPQGEQFFADQHEDALHYAAALAFPLVVKPSRGSHGFGCTTDCYSLEDVERGLEDAAVWCGKEGAFLIEEQKPGMEFRIFITKGGRYAVLHREPASITGDGVHSIRELAEEESFRRMNPRKNCLCPIMLDQTVTKFLARQNLTLASIPAENHKIYLRRNSNIAAGGSCEDFTDRAHATIIEKARQALDVFSGLPYAGIDILSSDISAEASHGNYHILEVNSNPGLHMHARPAQGNAQNVAAYLADMIFPETREVN